VLLLAELTLTWSWSVVGVLCPLLVFAFMRIRACAPSRRRRLSAARAVNAELAAQLSLPAVRLQMPARAFFQPAAGFAGV
jgi:predicted membrane-bound mannosyltransferase